MLSKKSAVWYMAWVKELEVWWMFVLCIDVDL